MIIGKLILNILHVNLNSLILSETQILHEVEHLIPKFLL